MFLCALCVFSVHSVVKLRFCGRPATRLPAVAGYPRRSGFPDASTTAQIARHTMPSKFPCNSLKTKKSGTQRVTHFSMTGLPVSTVSRAWEIRRAPSVDLSRDPKVTIRKIRSRIAPFPKTSLLKRVPAPCFLIDTKTIRNRRNSLKTNGGGQV
jgi:hypothetical protein